MTGNGFYSWREKHANNDQSIEYSQKHDSLARGLFLSLFMKFLIVVATVFGTAVSGCTPPVTEKAALIEDKVYAVAPDQIKVKAGILPGEVTGMTVIERVGQGAGRVNSAAKLKGKLRLTGSSKDQSVRMIIGKQLSKRIGL